MQKPDVTVVMLPRERFSFTQRSIESLYEDQRVPFNFICIDGGSPRKVRNYLRLESARRGFKLIRTPYFLTPHEARNLAFDHIKTKYVVFVDNDVVFAPMWLEHLVKCAEETDAAIVAPLTCIGEIPHTIIHMAGGDASITVEDGKRIFREKHFFYDRPVAEVQDQLMRKQIELAEYHCMLVKTEWLKRLGRFDEGLKAAHEHTDFCLTVREHGGLIVIEPRAIVTQIFGPPLFFSDLKFFFCRWCDEWTIDSERYFHKKWGTVFDDTTWRIFVLPRRRFALPRFREMVRTYAGWRISEWLLNQVVCVLTWLAQRERPMIIEGAKHISD